jgi:hypothetical protein
MALLGIKQELQDFNSKQCITLLLACGILFLELAKVNLKQHLGMIKPFMTKYICSDWKYAEFGARYWFCRNWVLTDSVG